MDRRGKRKGRNTASDSRKRESSLYTIEEPLMPRPHCDRCQGDEALRAGLDCRCHCENCCELSPRCSSPRMAQLQGLNNCACYLDRLATAKSFKNSQPEKTKSSGKKKAAGKVVPEICVEEVTTQNDMESTIRHTKTEAKPILKATRKALPPLKLPILSISERPIKKIKQKRCKTTCDSLVERIPTDSKYRRPHCTKCSVAGCLRKLEQDICYCNTCMDCNGQECSSPRMDVFRKTHPNCSTTSIRSIKEEKDLL